MMLSTETSVSLLVEKGRVVLNVEYQHRKRSILNNTLNRVSEGFHCLVSLVDASMRDTSRNTNLPFQTRI